MMVTILSKALNLDVIKLPKCNISELSVYQILETTFNFLQNYGVAMAIMVARHCMVVKFTFNISTVPTYFLNLNYKR